MLILGLLVAVGLGAVVAPVVAGLLGVAGLASEHWVRALLFDFPELVCAIAGYDKPPLPGMMAGWAIEFFPLGIVIALLLRIRRKRNAVNRAAAFEQAVSVFHSQYDEDAEAEDDSAPVPMRPVQQRDAA